MKTKIDLNCDLGEFEPFSITERLISLVTSVNIACGGHAGTVESMRACIRLALQYGVRVGAHPGLKSPGFGRAAEPVSPYDLKVLILHQVSALETLGSSLGARLHHVKLHGFLYHLVEENKALRDAFLEIMMECWPTTIIFAQAGGTVVREARERGLFVWEEVFLDRGYKSDTHLVQRSQPGALLADSEQIKKRLELLRSGRVDTVEGGTLPVQPQTISLHADSPHAVEFARIAREMIS